MYINIQIMKKNWIFVGIDKIDINAIITNFVCLWKYRLLMITLISVIWNISEKIANSKHNNKSG